MKPPMNDRITLHITEYDENGEPITTQYGQTKRTVIKSAARVKYTRSRDFQPGSAESKSILDLAIPPETQIHDGDIVEWVDRFGVTVKEPIISFTEVLNYSGKVVYYRKAWAGEK